MSKASNDNPTLRLATYNVLGTEHYKKANEVCPGCSSKDRAKLSTDVIKGKGGTKAFDVVGVQEMRPDQYEYLKKIILCHQVTKQIQPSRIFRPMSRLACF